MCRRDFTALRIEISVNMPAKMPVDRYRISK